jgi:hypothetical protein
VSASASRELLQIATGFCLVEAALIWRFARRPSSNRWVALHLVLFWAFVAVYSAVALLTREVEEYEPLLFLLTHAIVLAYIGLFASFSRLLRWRFPAPGAMLSPALGQDDWQLAFWLLCWLLFKAYLYPRYGLHSFELLRVREDIGASYWEASVNRLLGFPALGALLVFLLRAARSPRTLLRPHLTGPAVAFFVLFGMTNEVAGARRFFCALLVWIAHSLAQDRALRTRLQHLAVAGVVLLAALAFSEYFQRIRHNLQPELGTPVGDPLTDVIGLLVPGSDETGQTLLNLQVREHPFDVLYRVTEAQVAHGKGTGGALVAQAWADTMPAALHPGKGFVDHDVILAGAYGLAGSDIAAVPLVSLQSDFSWMGCLLAPLLYLLFLWVYCWKQARPPGGSGLVALSAAAAAFLTVFRVEDGLESLFVTFRDFAILGIPRAIVAWIPAPRGVYGTRPVPTP